MYHATNNKSWRRAFVRERERKKMEPIGDLERELEELRETYKSGKTKEASWRRSQLKSLLSLLEEREEDIFQALHQDIGKNHVESYRDEVF